MVLSPARSWNVRSLADFRVVILSTATEILLGVDPVVIDG
jgi:hypothetical protein